MNASLVSRVAQAICQAQASGRVTPAGIAAALESAGYLAVPGEVRELCRRVAELDEVVAAAWRATAGAVRERDQLRERVAEPYGCAHCGTERRGHGRRYLSDVGMHQWVKPSDEQVQSRMLARRAARSSVAALVARVAELEAAAGARPATAWVLMSGEDHEGGNALGVFATRDAAKGAFLEAARRMPFALDDAREEQDGSLHLHGGCDWLSLRPFPMQTQAALPSEVTPS